MQPRTVKDLCEQLWAAEKSIGLPNIKIGMVRIWPYIRATIYMLMGL